MDAFGINWQFLVAQLLNLFFLLALTALIALLGAVLLRRFHPRLMSHFLADLSAEADGLTIPSSYLGSSDTFELRRYGRALLLIERHR